MTLRSIDHSQGKGEKRKDYRIAEPLRERGTAVHAGGERVRCCGCRRQIAPSTKRLALGGCVWCLLCAISLGLLVEMPSDPAQAALNAGIAWA